MSPPLVDRYTGDVIPASDHNDVKSYIEDGTYRVNTLSLNIEGVGEVISNNGYATPVRIQAKDSSGIQFYASNGTTKIGELDESGNLLILGRVLRL